MALGAGTPATLSAQGPRGAGPDARTPAPGELRIGFASTWSRTAERYEDEVLRQLGARFSFATLGVDALPTLGPAEAAARIATGLPEFEASLGRLDTDARVRFESTPISVEYGITSRLAVGVLVPFVTSIARVDAVIDGAAGRATVGLNPARLSQSVVDANGLLVTQLDAAAAALAQQVATCQATPSTPGCGPIIAGTAAAQALVTESAKFSTALGNLYGGRAGAVGAAFVPLAGSTAQAAVAARLAGLKAQYAAFGIAQISAGPPTGAPAPITSGEFQQLLGDAAYGVAGSPLASVVRRGLGDIEVAAQFRWWDSYGPQDGPEARFWWRSAVAGAFRRGSGLAAPPTDLIPVPRGDHQNDLELRSVTDIGIGDRWSLTAALRFTQQQPADYSVRVPDNPGDPFPGSYRTVTATSDPGDEMAIELFPRWTLSEAVSIAASYGYRRRGEDDWSGRATATAPDGTSVEIDAAALNANTAQREHRFGASVAYSTVAAFGRGRARWPVEFSISHYQTSAGSGGYVPKVTYDAVQLRWYWRPFGGAAPNRQTPR